MEFAPHDELGTTPNIVVDGFGTASTVLTLSHWPNSGTPEELADDLSTQIAFRYLDRPRMHVDAQYVSNNHFDEDGLCGILAVLDPGAAGPWRERLIDVASAGDFGTYRHRNAARIAFALTAYADEDLSPMGAALFASPYPVQTAVLYEELIPRLPEMLDHPEHYRPLWEDEDDRLDVDEARVAGGEIDIDERPEVDLAIVRLPEDRTDGCHPMALHNATRRMRVLEMQDRRYRLRYRYETWVHYISEPVAPRVDLAPLASRLNEFESNGRWTFDGVDQITPSLHLSVAEDSDLSPERFTDLIIRFLSEA